MGLSIVDEVIQTLQDGGVRAARAYPAERMMAIQTPVAAVSLQQMDQGTGEITVRVDIVAAYNISGERCEKTALLACQVLAEAGAVCRQEAYEFDGEMNMCRIPVLAVYYGQALPDSWTAVTVPEPSTFTVTLAGNTLEYAVGFTAEQDERDSITAQTDSDGAPVYSISNAYWYCTVEEYFPTGVTEPAEISGSCTAVLTRDGMTDTFTGCVLTERKRVTDGDGTRQYRTFRAAARTAG
ncbi:MAG: hypothetical protein LUJ09_03215 [Firmicutes bacterium]|nr:hypothetical protein [Bacillota bacterium]